MKPGLQPSIALRDKLLREESWLDRRAIATYARESNVYGDTSKVASTLEIQRDTIRVKFRGAYLYPEFQFAVGRVSPHIRQLLHFLPDADDGWAAVFWCFRHSPRLLGKRAADVFRYDPLVVIEAAEKDFCGDPTDW